MIEEPGQVAGLLVSGVALRMVISTRSSDQFGPGLNAGLLLNINNLLCGIEAASTVSVSSFVGYRFLPMAFAL
jgi:hypothetical protein